jgi:hypothetical protein
MFSAPFLVNTLFVYYAQQLLKYEFDGNVAIADWQYEYSARSPVIAA